MLEHKIRSSNLIIINAHIVIMSTDRRPVICLSSRGLIVRLWGYLVQSKPVHQAWNSLGNDACSIGR